MPSLSNYFPCPTVSCLFGTTALNKFGILIAYEVRVSRVLPRFTRIFMAFPGSLQGSRSLKVSSAGNSGSTSASEPPHAMEMRPSATKLSMEWSQKVRRPMNTRGSVCEPNIFC